VVFQSVEVVKRLMQKTTTCTGLRVEVEIDTTNYVRGRKVAEQTRQSLRLLRDEHLPKFNYRILPRPLSS
jgi:hypothetical protein